MPILPIKKYPETVLRKKAREIKFITPEIKNLIANMKETIATEEGIGLAASQVGVLERVIVLKTEKGLEVFINPKILKKSKEKEVAEEGCLSFPSLWLKIKRPKEVEIRTLNEKEEKLETKVQGLLARVFQHEIDHLDGILFIDRLSFWQRIKIKKRLKELSQKWN